MGRVDAIYKQANYKTKNDSRKFKVKKQLICMMALAALLMTSATAFASTTATSTTGGYNVTTDAAEIKKTVLITNDSDGSIVYVGQSDNVNSSATEFLLKADAADGAYTIKLGDGTATPAMSISFYIGMNEGAGDVNLTYVGESISVDNKKNIGYKADNVSIGVYKSVIIKRDGKYMGYDLTQQTGTELSGDGNGTLGIQINGVDLTVDGSKDMSVWLSTRTFNSSNESLTK